VSTSTANGWHCCGCPAGAISKLGEVYVYQGRLFPVVSLIAAALHRLAATGMVTLTEPDRSVVSLTEAGQARYKTPDQPPA
jgi:hypothetical protein